ncbi:MAG: flagellar hook-length control protein FliK [Clostridiales bacterium]|nr:flagellar hook-length control protein FliK [Clostridiales bacterium]
MQAVNAEYGKPFDAVPLWADGKPRAPAKEGSSFLDIVGKALSEKDASCSSDDLQMGVLIAMLAEADVTVQPIDVIGQVRARQGHGQEMQQKAQAAPEAQHEAAAGIQESAVKQEGVAEAAASTVTPAREANQAKPETAKPEPAVAKAAQQNAQTSNEKSEQTQVEKQAPAKSEANSTKPADIRQETAKGVKQEAAKDFKQEIAGPARQETQIDTEKTYIRVGDGDKIGSEKFASEVSDKILAKMTEGKQQFEVELMPRELGKIIIKLVMQNGKAEIIMQCLNPKTQQLVMMNMESIRAIVEERTGMQTAVTVKEDAEARSDMDGKGQGKQSGQDGQQEKKWAEAEADIFLQQLRLGLAELSDT